MKKTHLILVWLCIVAGLCGCGPKTKNIDMANDEGQAVLELDYRDLEQAAEAMIQSLLSSGVLRKDDNSRYVVATGRIVNDTMQKFDTDMLMGKIEKAMFDSGQVVMTSAVGGQGASDEMVYQVRDLKEGDREDEFNQETLPGKGQIVAPELSIAGKIIQRNITYDRKTQQVEYHFLLQLTEIASGLRFWQDEKVLGKRGDKKSTPW
jgi:uncharacterized protein (TIGR02722 family)